MNQDRPLPARTLAEARYYLMVTPCPHCAKGPWEVQGLPGEVAAGAEATCRAACKHCGALHDFAFGCELGGRADESETPEINPTPAASTLVDLRQWLGLFYSLLERADSAHTPRETRQYGYQAALCLAEALKFYSDDNELPSQKAFFTPQSLAAFREHPEKFARQKLRDMQAKLPTLPAMARRVQRDDKINKRHWWQFWRK